MAAAVMAARNSGRSTADMEDKDIVQRIPGEEARRMDLVLGTLLVGCVSPNYVQARFHVLTFVSDLKFMAEKKSYRDR